MSSQKWIVRSGICLALAALAGCGSSDDSNQAVAPPGGSFSNSNLNGAYVFSFSGYDTGNGSGSFFAMVGSLTANGAGGFTNGTVDIVDPALGAWFRTSYIFSRLPTTSGNYNITADGRGSGTIDLQTSGFAQDALQGSYAFALNGVDSTVANPLATVGSFTLDPNGTITAGLQDFNDDGNSANLQALPVQGTVLVGSPQTAQLTTSAAGFGTSTSTSGPSTIWLQTLCSTAPPMC